MKEKQEIINAINEEIEIALKQQQKQADNGNRELAHFYSGELKGLHKVLEILEEK